VRIFVNGEADLPVAVEAQRGFALMPLSAYLREGLAYSPAQTQLPESVTTDAPTDLQVFADLGRAMQAFLPASADQADTFVAALGQIGLSVAHGFAWWTLDESTQRGLARVAPIVEEIVDRRWEAMGETTNGWRYNVAGGRAGYDFALRAALAKYMVGGQLATEVLYPNTRVDDKGEPFSGERRYTLHFAADQIPPVATFWNLSLYGDDMLFVENDLGRYSIGSTTDGLTTAEDGSITLFIQRDKPEGAAAANWLPAPTGSFNLTMRLYGPLTPILDGSYRLPAMQRVGEPQRLI
jgi:hypothetical protein